MRELLAVRVYIGTPGNQMQADLVSDLPVLVSFGAFSPWLSNGGYMSSFGRVLLDSGAFSELNSGKKIDLSEYIEWVQRWPWVDAFAGLDDISGDWRRSLRNYEKGGFPTMHDTDPDELLVDLISIAEERGNWLGIGLKPPRSGRDEWLKRTLDKIPPHIHVHGWALGRYAHHQRIDSFDSTHAWREWVKIRKALGEWATSSECLRLAVTKVRRQSKIVVRDDAQNLNLFE